MAGAVTIRGAATVGCSLLALGCVGAFALSGAPGILAVGLGGNLLANWIDRYGPDKLASLLTGPLSLPKHDDMVRVADLALSCALRALLTEMEPAFNSAGKAGGDFSNCLKIWRNEAESHTRLASTEAAAAITTALAHLSGQSPAQALNQLLADAIAPDMRHTGDATYMKAWQGLADRLRSRLPELLTAYVAEALKTDERFFRAVTLTQQRAMVKTGRDVLTALQQQSDMLDRLREQLRAHIPQSPATIGLADFKAALSQGLAALETAIRAELDADRAPKLTWPNPSQQAGQELSLLYYDRKAPLVGRDAAMAALNLFIDDPRILLWTTITGSAGVGKSRLVLEVLSLRLLLGGIEAGFMKPSDAWLTEQQYKNWRAPQPTVLVIDYAGVSPDLIRDLIYDLACRTGGRTLSAPVRLLLLDTHPNQGQFALANRIMDNTTAGIQAKLVAWADPAQTALELSPLSPGDALSITELYRDAPLTALEKGRVNAAVRGDPELSRPLFAALMGLALRHGTDTPLTLSSVTSHFLDRQEIHWAERDQITQLDRTLLALATLGGSVPLVEVLKDPLLADLLPTTGKAPRLTLRQHWSVMTGKPLPDTNLTKLEPDYVGGLYLLRHLKQAAPGDPREPDEVAAEVERLIALAWKYGYPVEHLINLIRNFASDITLAPLIGDLTTFQPNIDRQVEWVASMPWITLSLARAKAHDTLDELLTVLTNLSFISIAQVHSSSISSVENLLLPDITDIPMEDRLSLLSKYPLKTAIAERIAISLIHILYYKTPSISYANRVLNFLRKIKEDNASVEEFNLMLAQGLRNASNHAKPNSWRDVLLDELEELHNNNLNNPLICEEFASGLVNALHDVGENVDRSETLLIKLRFCIQKFPENIKLQRLLAVGQLNASSYAGADKSRSTRLLGEARRLSRQYKNDLEISAQFAYMLTNWLKKFGMTTALASRVLNDLRNLAKNHRENKMIAMIFISCLVNALYYYHNRLKCIELILIELRESYEFFKFDVDVSIVVCKGLVNAIPGEGATQRRLDSIIADLEKINKNYPSDPEIKHQFAMGLLNCFITARKKQLSIKKYIRLMEKFTTLYPGEPLVRSDLVPLLRRFKGSRLV